MKKRFLALVLAVFSFVLFLGGCSWDRNYNMLIAVADMIDRDGYETINFKKSKIAELKNIPDANNGTVFDNLIYYKKGIYNLKTDTYSGDIFDIDGIFTKDKLITTKDGEKYLIDTSGKRISNEDFSGYTRPYSSLYFKIFEDYLYNEEAGKICIDINGKLTFVSGLPQDCEFYYVTKKIIVFKADEKIVLMNIKGEIIHEFSANANLIPLSEGTFLVQEKKYIGGEEVYNSYIDGSKFMVETYLANEKTVKPLNNFNYLLSDVVYTSLAYKIYGMKIPSGKFSKDTIISARPKDGENFLDCYTMLTINKNGKILFDSDGKNARKISSNRYLINKQEEDYSFSYISNKRGKKILTFKINLSVYAKKDNVFIVGDSYKYLHLTDKNGKLIDNGNFEGDYFLSFIYSDFYNGDTILKRDDGIYCFVSGSKITPIPLFDTEAEAVVEILDRFGLYYVKQNTEYRIYNSKNEQLLSASDCSAPKVIFNTENSVVVLFNDIYYKLAG